MKLYLSLFIVMSMFLTREIYAQQDRRLIREGNREFEKEKYEDSEILYRKAMEDTKLPYVTSFNIGDALYKQEKYEEAAKKFKELSEQESEKLAKAGSFHNLGNSFLQANKLEESIEAYKSALRKNPNDLETKYNLAFAQDKLKEQQEQQEQNKDQNQDQDKQDQNKDQENQDNKPQDQDQNKEQDQEPSSDQISKEVAERILQALQEQEKDVQEKVKKAKAAKARVKTVINW
jgi:tetratricopeptide (TPR) repeat protein